MMRNALVIVAAGLAVTLSTVPARAQFRIEHSVVAWSPDEKFIAIRDEYREYSDGCYERFGSSGCFDLAISIISTSSGENIKNFVIDTSSATERTRAWRRVEQWLEKNRYSFVIGKAQEKAKVALALAGKPTATDLVGTSPLPAALVPKELETAHLEVAWERSDEGSNVQALRLVARRRGSTTQLRLSVANIKFPNAVAVDVAHATLEDAKQLGYTCPAAQFSPSGEWLVLTCSVPDVMASTRGYYDIVDLSAITFEGSGP